jgi:type 1 glutamine amidotransferase
MHSLRILLVAVCLSSVLAASAGCGAWRVFFPSHAHETVPPELPESLPAPAVLIFSKTNGFRHEEAIPAGLALFEEVAARRGWSLFHTENGATFSPEILSRFAVAVWHNTSGDTLNEEQRAAFKDWLEQGGGFVGIHGAGGDPSYDWSWYVEELIGAQFIGHIMGPQFQDATLVIEDADHPVTASLPERFTHNEEWYSFDRSVRERPGFQVLASVDESSYSPRMKMLWMDDDLSMGDHPIVWTRCVGRGRALFSALGHQPGAYTNPEPARLLENAIAWTARLQGPGCE